MHAINDVIIYLCGRLLNRMDLRGENACKEGGENGKKSN